MLTVPLAVMLAVGSADVEQRVEEAMQPVVPMLRGCFISRDAPSARAVLRFTVDDDGHVVQPRLEENTVDDARLNRCLLSAVSDVAFPSALRGRDVAYPVRYQAPDQSPERAARVGPRLRVVHAPRPLGDSWQVVDETGRPVSDLDLAMAAGATELHAELRSTRTAYAALAIGEALLAAAALGVAAYGGYGWGQRPDDPRAADVAMAGGGLLTAGLSGGLMLFHTLRAIDTSASRPVWHHLDQDTTRQLVEASRARKS